MTEATPEVTTPTLTEVLVRNAFYMRNGVVRMAIGDDTLVDPTGTETMKVTPQDVTLVDEPGSTGWVDRMINIRASLAQTNRDLAHRHQVQYDHLERMGQAILEKAEEHDWCGEYDEFAAEWGLPTRVREYAVTMTVRIEARNEEMALQVVQERVDLDCYHTDGVVSDPDFYANEVD